MGMKPGGKPDGGIASMNGGMPGGMELGIEPKPKSWKTGAGGGPPCPNPMKPMSREKAGAGGGSSGGGTMGPAFVKKVSLASKEGIGSAGGGTARMDMVTAHPITSGSCLRHLIPDSYGT